MRTTKSKISLQPSEYLRLAGIPILGLGFSILILVFSEKSYVGFVLMFAALVWIIKVFQYLFYDVHEIRITKKQLFEVIDAFVEHKKWEYGNICDNEITLSIVNKNGVKSILYIKYFEEKLWVTSLFENQKPMNIFNASLKSNIEEFLRVVHLKLRNKTLNDEVLNPSPEMRLKSKSEWTVKKTFERIIGYFGLIVFLICVWLNIKEGISFSQVIYWLFIFIFFLYPYLSSDIKMIRMDYKRRKKKRF